MFSLRHSLHFIRFDHPNSSAINLGTSDNPFGLVALTANARQAEAEGGAHIVVYPGPKKGSVQVKENEPFNPSFISIKPSLF